MTIGTKYFEIAVIAFAAVALLRFHSSPTTTIPLLLAAVFLASCQAAIFGPSKYGMLPELLPDAELSWGNGVIELGTFLAIILGTVAGSRLPEFFAGREVNGAYFFLIFGIVGLGTAHLITKLPAADPGKKFRANAFLDLFVHLRNARADRPLWLAIVGNTYFWFLGALLQFNVVLYGERVLHVPGSESAKLQAAIAIGIGVGSYAAGALSGGKIEYGLVPLGGLGMTLFGFLLSLPQLSFNQILGLLAALGFSGGFFIVPISALIQHRPDEKDKGGVIASANLLSFVGVAAAAAVPTLFSQYLHLGPRAVFLWASIGTLIAAVYLVFLLPDSLLRLSLWFATHTIYRIHMKGGDNVPARGGAMLCPNHSSMVDGVLLIASTDRPIRFLMFKGSYEHWLVKPFAKIMGVIPIASNQGPRELIHSLRAATDALKNGELVCIFPEGQMTRIGQMLPFRRGLERIMKGVEAPIIPVYIDGVWGSIFSFAGRKVSLEISAENSLPGAGDLRYADSFHFAGARSAQAGARTGSGRICGPERPPAGDFACIYSHGATASVPICDGRRTNATAHLFFGTNEGYFSRPATAKTLERSADGGAVFATFDPGRAGELCSDADGQSAGQFELHRFAGDAGILRAAM